MKICNVNYKEETIQNSKTKNSDKVAYGKEWEHLFQKVETGKDIFEKSENVKVFNSENYSDIKKVIEMPGSIFGDQFGYDMHDKMVSYMEDFYAGKIGQKELESFFEECCISMKEYRTRRCQTSGSNEADNKQIVSQMYELFCKESQRAARNANYEEGKEINSEYGGREDDFVYYNADYYYKHEDTRTLLKDMVGKMTEQWELSEIDIAEVEKNTQYTLDGNLDFNSGWNMTYRNNVSRGSMIDENKIPPRDFKLFYKESPYENSADIQKAYIGILRFECRSYKKEIEFKFKEKNEGNVWYDRYIYNVSELIKVPNGLEGHQTYNSFLSNFEIFTRAYASATGINNQFGNYSGKENSSGS